MADSIAAMLMSRVGDQHPGLRTRDRDWTWDEVVIESARRAALATELHRSRFPDAPLHIGILLPNVADFVFWLGAAALSGATVVGLNPTRSDGDLAADIDHADCAFIVTDTAGRSRLSGIALDTLVIDDPSYRALVDRHRSTPSMADGVSAESLLLLLFTSGTTGTSKAVRCSQGRLARIAATAVDKFGHHRGDVDYCCMPLFHGNALMALWAPALAVGATVCLTPTFSASAFLPDVRYYGATFFTYVGKALAYLLSTPEAPDDGENTLTRGFGTEASPEDQAEFRRRFGAELFEGYGSSEGGNAAVPDGSAPAGALGRPAHAGITIVDPENLKTCATAILDAHGRVRNAEAAVGEIVDKFGARDFEGYYRNDAADAERLRNGWYWTGDLGYVDGDGFLYFAGRRGDWIRVDGENTSALTIERVLRRHPEVIAAAVYAVPDPRSGDQVMAAVEVGDPAAFDMAAFAGFLASAADLGRKGVPQMVRLSTGLPVTGSGKILKRELQEQRWDDCGDPVHLRVGRGAPNYRLMTAADRDTMDAVFAHHRRAR
ncbi:AMP-binding protein [Mycolicibacterium tokaiense]|uniref:Acyl-CoA synthetase n=1 Tax=Mycolicibacterium tokaiense TaxID=39695 RepID=A0A378THD0_9MYCO|nr:AMP-binding protein [Mycolicibacterium tokaiense]BBY86539.1 putative fatty-acid-CoA ligase FadD [Mycolicibacterium tokaiense]STZ58956.1 acyl-CoA synthetase [Mycolicibacterium tokaiense]